MFRLTIITTNALIYISVCCYCLCPNVRWIQAKGVRKRISKIILFLPLPLRLNPTLQKGFKNCIGYYQLILNKGGLVIDY